MNLHLCKCGKGMREGVYCRKCLEARARNSAGKKAKGRRSVPVAKEYFEGPYGKYLSQVFARSEP